MPKKRKHRWGCLGACCRRNRSRSNTLQLARNAQLAAEAEALETEQASQNLSRLRLDDVTGSVSTVPSPSAFEFTTSSPIRRTSTPPANYRTRAELRQPKTKRSKRSKPLLKKLFRMCVFTQDSKDSSTTDAEPSFAISSFRESQFGNLSPISRLSSPIEPEDSLRNRLSFDVEPEPNVESPTRRSQVGGLPKSPTRSLPSSPSTSEEISIARRFQNMSGASENTTFDWMNFYNVSNSDQLPYISPLKRRRQREGREYIMPRGPSLVRKQSNRSLSPPPSPFATPPPRRQTPPRFPTPPPSPSVTRIRDMAFDPGNATLERLRDQCMVIVRHLDSLRARVERCVAITDEAEENYSRLSLFPKGRRRFRAQ